MAVQKAGSSRSTWTAETRRGLSSSGVGTGPALSFAISSAMDEARQRLFMLADTLVEVDLRNGNRVAHTETPRAWASRPRPWRSTP